MLSLSSLFPLSVVGVRFGFFFSFLVKFGKTEFWNREIGKTNVNGFIWTEREPRKKVGSNSQPTKPDWSKSPNTA